MRRFSHLLGSCALLASLFGAVSRADAQEEDRSISPRQGHDDTRRYVTVTVNPLGLALARYGGNIEVSPFPHHAFAASLYAQSVPMWLARAFSVRDEINDTGGATLGGELGYRLYSGRSGADGLFVGPSFVSMPLAYPRLASDLRSADLVRFSAMGAALDIGFQKVTSSGFTVGGGIGVMYLSYDLPADNRRLPIGIEPHVLPRLLLAAGWSF
jgi:hypothetical protein